MKFQEINKDKTALLLAKITDDEMTKYVEFYQKNSLVAIENNNIVAIAQINNFMGSYSEIRMSVLKQYRNQGYGKTVFENLLFYCLDNYDPEMIVTLIDKNNIASIKCVEKYLTKDSYLQSILENEGGFNGIIYSISKKSLKEIKSVYK